MVVAVFAGEGLDVVHGLGLGSGEVAASGFVFGDEAAFPKKVDEVIAAGEVAEGFFEAGDGAAAEAETFEEFVPEGLGFSAFA